jgi:hypothetical protein
MTWNVKTWLLLSLTLLSTPCVQAAAATPSSGQLSPQEAAALADTLAWLALVDSGHYEAAWQQAAPQLRAGLKQQDWQQSLRQVRERLGRLQSRELAGAFATGQLPGAPKGDYLVLQFECRYAGRSAPVMEIVNPVLSQGDNGEAHWRVVGYYLKAPAKD